jgi:hypothetical protein
MTLQPTVLEITTLQDNRYRFCLIEPGELFMGPTQQIWDIRFQPMTVAALCRRLTDAAARAHREPDAPGAGLDPFITAGRGLYEALLPTLPDGNVADLRRALRELKTPLLISTDDPDVFWELLHDSEGDGFLALKYDVGRRLRRATVPRSSVPSTGQWRCLMIADPSAAEPRWALPNAGSEADQLANWLSGRNVNCDDYLRGEDATFDAVLERLLLHPYDIIHYSGHVIRDDAGDFGLRLHGGAVLASGDIRNFVKGRPIVFLNGCSSGKAVEGLTAAFLDAGAQLVIGSLFEAPDAGARAFAETFYESILNGVTVGAALRQARQGVSGKAEFGAAWAGYVMYGNPCLRIDWQESAAERALRPHGLRRDDFEPAAWRVVEQAFEYGKEAGGLATAHLFAALVGGEDDGLRCQLRAQNVPPAALQKAFQEAFRRSAAEAEPEASSGTLSLTGAPAAGGAAPGKLSTTVSAILTGAIDTIRAAGGTRASEADLLRALIERGAGRTGRILRKLGVELQRLAPSTVTAEPTPCLVRLGPLSRSDCTFEAWRVLAAAVDLASRSGSTVATAHLFAAMTCDPGGPLSSGLRRYGISPGQLRELIARGWRCPGEDAACPAEEIKCSHNAGRLLAQAAELATLAQRTQVDDRDLLVAFVQTGGGMTGRFLRQQSVVIEALISQIFRNDGSIESGRFCERALNVLRAATELARQKGQELLDRGHLLYALLASEGSRLGGWIRAESVDVERLVDLLHAHLPSGISLTGPVELRPHAMEPELVKILCAAESAAALEVASCIGEDHLIHALAADGGGAIGEFLAMQGVRLRRFLTGDGDLTRSPPRL